MTLRHTLYSYVERRYSVTRRFYHTAQFARKAGVSARTLRYYEAVGLLSPAQHSSAGHRLYSDEDLVILQQILALKFLGFSLQEIKGYLRAGSQPLQEVLAKQKAMLREQRAQIDTIIRAIEEVEQVADADQCTLEAIVHVIEVIQMKQKDDWVNKYLTPEQRQTMEELSKKSYSDAAQQKMAAWGEWTEEDQRRVDQQYAFISSELKRLIAGGQDPASAEAQAIAKLKIDLEEQFTKGDPEIRAGLQQWWEHYADLPDAEKPMVSPWGVEEEAFLAQAVAMYKQRETGGS
jgi:DNA-binding transcriptional MerR regulator